MRTFALLVFVLSPFLRYTGAQVYCQETPLSSLDSAYLTDMHKSKGKAVSRYKAPRSGLDVDGYTVAPAVLELEQVHVYIRHGE